jgi:hypothetical protein
MQGIGWSILEVSQWQLTSLWDPWMEGSVFDNAVSTLWRDCNAPTTKMLRKGRERQGLWVGVLLDRFPYSIEH